MTASRVLLFAFVFISLTSFGQTVVPMGGAPKGILFREFENVIQITDEKRENREFKVVFTGGFIETIEANDAKSSEGRYVLRATTANLNPEVIIFDSAGQVLNIVAFTVQEIPASGIKFATENGAYSKNVKQLLVSNPIPFLERLQEIAGWRITIDGVMVLEGKGSRLSEMASYQLSKLPSGTSFEIEAFLLDYNGVVRSQKSNFSIN